MRLSFAQRVGLVPAPLDQEERRKLRSARAASSLLLLQPGLALAAAAASGTVALPGVVAAACSLLLAAIVLNAYEVLPASTKALVVVGGVLVICTFTLFQPSGALYALLHVGVVFYICFFHEPRRAVVQTALVLAIVAVVSLAVAPTVRSALETLILTVGAFVGAAGFTIVVRRRLIAALDRARATTATLDAFFLHASTGFAFLDRELRHVRVNEPLAAMLGIPADQLVGRTVRELAPHHADALEPVLRGVLETGKAVENLELASVDGTRHYLVSYYPVTGPDGARGLGENVVDVTHLKDVERRLEETNRRLTVLATTDELTGLPNRRLLGEQLDLALARARRGGLGVALLCVDLDRFKEVNDTLGHAYGDEFLVEIARRLRASARETDVVARVGGDEFLVMLADLDVQEAPELAATVVERIRCLLAEPILVGAVELRAEASVGVAIYPLDSRDAKGLLAAADAAMYAGKSSLTRVA